MAAKKTINTTENEKNTAKKKSPILLIVVGIVVILLIAMVLPKLQKSDKAVNVGESESKSSNAFTSIKDALSKSVSIACTYTDPEGRETKTYIKNGAIRTDVSGESAGSVIMKDKTMYSWDPAKKEGVKMVLDEKMMNPEGEKVEGYNQDWQSPEEAAEALEQYKDNCKAEIVSDSLFVPPTDVKFMDLSEMMKNPESFMQQYGN